jgi:hypothetical protein
LQSRKYAALGISDNSQILRLSFYHILSLGDYSGDERRVGDRGDPSERPVRVLGGGGERTAAAPLLGSLQVFCILPMLRIRDPGSGAFLTPGSGIRNRFIPNPGSQAHILRAKRQFFCVKSSLIL